MCALKDNLGKVGRRAFALLMAAVLVVSLGPFPAQAASLSAGQSAQEFSTMAASSSAARAATVKMAVLVQQKNASHGDKSSFSYNKNGLLSSEVDYDMQKVSGRWTTMTKVYKTNAYNKSGNLTRSVHKTVYAAALKRSSVKQTYTSTYNSKGKLTKKSWKDVKTGKTVSQTYEYGKTGRLWRVKQTAPNANKTYNWYIYSYDKKGRVSSIKTAQMKKSGGKWVRVGSYKLTETFTYDSKGQVKMVKSTISPKKSTFAYTYKSGRVVKRKATLGTVKATTTYKYKIISVPKAYAAKVKQQQKDLINPTVGV